MIEKSISNIFMCLGGPSVKKLEEYINAFHSEHTLYCAINDKSGIESQILNNVNASVNVWFVLSAEEVLRLKDEILAFLKKEDSLYFVTTRYAFLILLSFIKENTATFNKYAKKIVYIDELHDEVFSHAPEGSAPNTLTFALLFFLRELRDKTTPIYLLGCDGVSKEDYNIEDTYFNSGKLAKIRRTHALEGKQVAISNLFRDQVEFNKNWDIYLSKILGLTKNDINVLNVNQKSQIEVFDRISYEQAKQNFIGSTKNEVLDVSESCSPKKNISGDLEIFEKRNQNAQKVIAKQSENYKKSNILIKLNKYLRNKISCCFSRS